MVRRVVFRGLLISSSKLISGNVLWIIEAFWCVQWLSKMSSIRIRNERNITPMRCIILAPRFHTNQIELVRYMLANDWEVEFYVTGVGVSENHDQIEPHVIELSLLYKLFGRLWKTADIEFIRKYKWGVPSIREVLRFVFRKPDSIIVRNPYAMIAVAYSLLSRVLGVKIVYYTQRPVHRKPRVIKDHLTKFLMKVFDAKWITPVLGDARFGRISHRMYYIPFCMKPVKYEKNWFQNDLVNILSIGKFVERKSHHVLIDSLRALSSKYKFRVTIIGEVSDVTGFCYYERILRMISTLPFEINIEINLDHQSVLQYFRNNDVFILPSKNEPASVSNLEAMSYGLPVITSDTNQTSCYTSNNGFVFESDNHSDLARKISVLLANRSKIVEMGKNSWKLVESNHDSDLVYRELIDDILR